MKLSNRILGLLILLGVLGIFYFLYQVFFKINLVNLTINSNISTFTGTIENLKFSKEFSCNNSKCIIKNIPSFEYKLNLFSEGYIGIQKNINLKENNNINVFFKKKIYVEKLDNKIPTKREEIIERSKKKIDFSGKIINYNNIYGDTNIVYINLDKKIIFYNLKNNNSFSVDFIPKINYIKKLSTNMYLINSEVGSYIYNLLNKNLDYFSLFGDFIVKGNNYIGIINNNDKIRKNNFGYKNKSGNLVIIYNFKDRSKYILKTFENEIIKIYILNSRIYLEDKLGNKYELKGF